MTHPSRLHFGKFTPILMTVWLVFLVWPSVKGFAQATDRGLVVTANGNALDGRGKLWAVVIGVSSYRNLGKDQQLAYAHRDAEAFAAFLRTPAGGGFPASQLRLLTNQQATLAAVRTELGTVLPRSAQPDDVVMIFFAGHGVVEGERDGYLLLHDSDPSNLYSTALQLSELDRIVTERIQARNVILITDACHAGQLGWASRGTKESAALINRYVNEVGKSGKGVFRLLASRANELSYEDKRWGGGHGVFTHYLLEGLNGPADRDGDGVVRATEILEYLSDAVPKATKALQHPQAAGTLDAELPLAIVKPLVAKVEKTPEKPAENLPTKPAAPLKLVKLEVRGAAGSEVYVDNTLRGRIGRNGTLVIEQLPAGAHEIAVRIPRGENTKQAIMLDNDHTVIEMNRPAPAAPKPMPLATQIKQAMEQGQTETALRLYEQLLRNEPTNSERPQIEAALGATMEAIGQKVVNEYLQAPLSKVNRQSFRQGAEAYKWLKLILAGKTNAQQEANYLFCESRALLEENRAPEALNYLAKATTLAPQSAHIWTAFGLAQDKLGQVALAIAAYQQAIKLAATWAEPQYHLGLLYLRIGQAKQAEQPLLQAAKLDPNSLEPRYQLVRMWRMNRQWKKAETEALAILRSANANEAAELQAGVWYELAQVYEATKRAANAAEAYEKVLTLAPNRSDREQLVEKVKALRGLLAKG